ncbi:MAG: STAS domain-containing protein [Mycobacterium sp.]|nr:STAS domain-containing protein [Mycobacterium sp.]
MDAQQVNFAVAEESVGAVSVVSVTGAIDMLTAPQLAEAIRAALAKQPSAVVVNLTEVDFLASAGMQVLVAANEEAGGTRLVVAAEGPATSRPLKITGITDFIDVFPTLDEALENVTV